MNDFESVYQTHWPLLKPKATRLLARIRRRYQTRTEVVRFGDVSFPFTRIKDPEAVLDEVAEEETRRTKIKKDGTVTFKGEPLRMPYWAELWESAEAISAWLVERSGQVEGNGTEPSERVPSPLAVSQRASAKQFSPYESASGKSNPLDVTTRPPPGFSRPTALDLGCGMGLAGCTAAACGYVVTFADIEAPSLLFAELNALPFHHVKCRKTNWQTDDLRERFDLIIGADILYERTQWDFLEPFWSHHLAENGKVLLGEPGRPTGEPFAEWIQSRGWTVSIEKRKVASRAEPIRLLILEK